MDGHLEVGKKQHGHVRTTLSSGGHEHWVGDLAGTFAKVLDNAGS